MPRPKRTTEPMERLILKVPRSVAVYFRTAFRHGERSVFFERCILEHQRASKVRDLEDILRRARADRQ
jgi:hypothetical protein